MTFLLLQENVNYETRVKQYSELLNWKTNYSTLILRNAKHLKESHPRVFQVLKILG